MLHGSGIMCALTLAVRQAREGRLDLVCHGNGASPKRPPTLPAWDQGAL